MSFLPIRNGMTFLRYGRRMLCEVQLQSCCLGPAAAALRLSSTSSGHPPKQQFVAIRLLPKSRKLLRITGVDSFIYLQSLLTNDMRRLLPIDRLQRDLQSSDPTLFEQLGVFDQPVVYSYLLSAVGKVLADVFVYRGRYRAEDGEHILEVDSKLASAMKRLLLGYNLSRNVKVEFANELDLWSLIPMSIFGDNFEVNHPHDLPELEEIDSDDIKLVRDPRLGPRYLGYRFLTRLGGSRLEDIGPYVKLANGGDGDNKKGVSLVEGTTGDYARLRYRLGVVEGHEEIQSGFYFPFELNGDLLNAVSLNKGLYTSEEKVIQIYSRDCIKQRLFPVQFLSSYSTLRRVNPPPRTLITTESNRKFGELRCRSGRFGIASLWVPMANNHFPSANYRRFPLLTHEDTGLKLRALIPRWWPKNIDQIQLPVPDYPRCLFNLSEDVSTFADEEPDLSSRFEGIPEDHFTTSLQVVQQEA